jgi:ankyrin repeat protein
VSELPPSPEDSDEVDALYRRASARDASRPSESVRRAVLDHAAQLAVNRAAGKDSARSGTALRAKRQSWWRPAAFGTLAAAALAGFLVIPQYLTPDAPINSTSSPAPAPTPAPATTPARPPTSSSAEVAQPQAVAPEPRTAAYNEAPAADAATQNVVVTAGKRMPAEDRKRQVAQNATREQSLAGAPSAPTAQSVPSEPSAQDSAQFAARSARSGASGTAALSSASPPAPPAFTSAARLTDPAAQLRQAAEMGDVAALRALLDGRAVVDARDAGGRTALMLATLHGRTEAVDALLSAGADPNAADANGTTPLQAALAGDQPAIAAALRRAGAR